MVHAGRSFTKLSLSFQAIHAKDLIDSVERILHNVVAVNQVTDSIGQRPNCQNNKKTFVRAVSGILCRFFQWPVVFYTCSDIRCRWSNAGSCLMSLEGAKRPL